MPVYEYLCEGCGLFTDMRPMAECDAPQDCLQCGATAPRVILTAPHFSTMSAERRTAHATNERSRAAPRTLSETKNAHGAGCSCCTGKSSRLVKQGKNGSKSFPTARPWMISH
jgi:putative FmdB family regulatory protein